MSRQSPVANSPSPRQIILAAIEHLDHVLPGQGPIHDFVHHNTLHGFQHLPFERALAEFTALTGIACYLPAEQFRAFYQQGRITDEDIDATLEQQFGWDGWPEPAGAGHTGIGLKQLYRLALLHDLPILTPAQLQWRLQETPALKTSELWAALLPKLELSRPDTHPEQALDLSSEQAEAWLLDDEKTTRLNAGQRMRQQTQDRMRALFAQVGENLSLRDLILALTGIDALNDVRSQLIRWCGSLLDEGLAAWRLPDRQNLGLYTIWRQTASHDLLPVFQELADWQTVQAALPEDAVDAIIQQLETIAIPQQRWAGYLQRLALELPGWAGLINWRQTHPDYRTDQASRPLLADYLAMRLVLDRLYLQPICHAQWRCPLRLDKLQAYFNKHSDECLVRQALFAADLPEYLAQAAQTLLADNSDNPRDWRILAERIWIWRQSPLADHAGHISAGNHGWRLFHVCQKLDLGPADLRHVGKQQLLAWLAHIDAFTAQQRNTVWLNAYERHYQQELLQAVHANHGRGRWLRRDCRPKAQIYFCMDEREESFRRHLEELNPAIETLGVAGFFGIAMNYKGLDAHHVTPLCPVVVTPAHRINEVTQPEQQKQLAAHRKGLQRAEGLSYQLHQNLRCSLIRAYPLVYALAPVQLLRLLGKSLWPTGQRLLEQAWQRWLVPKVATQLHFIATDTVPATSAAPKLGFTDREQAERVASFLKTTGLTHGFARIVALMGHGSTSQNNPHEAAHDCGACGGRQGGPNARAFAAMANRPQVRQLLSELGIEIPDDTWFVGGQHDTCSDIITWYDLDTMPDDRRGEFSQFKTCLEQADSMAAAERCRRFASAGRPASAKAAIRHVQNRAMDLSQVRPEFGHATNAAAFIGRRAATQGVFFDRRLFLISYDPSQDPEGTILENILLTAGPVGAGINLEYYFSSVNNEKLGCGTKIPHNVTGLFGVMEGTGSDLRTGLPLQMVEIHEAMRLQIVVEAKTTVLEQIYARQPGLQELIGGGWVHLSAKDPDSERIFVFQRGAGFVRWQPQNSPLPLRDHSPDCYRDSTQAVSPMLIKQPQFAGVTG